MDTRTRSVKTVMRSFVGAVISVRSLERRKLDEVPSILVLAFEALGTVAVTNEGVYISIDRG